MIASFFFALLSVVGLEMIDICHVVMCVGSRPSSDQRVSELAAHAPRSSAIRTSGGICTCLLWKYQEPQSRGRPNSRFTAYWLVDGSLFLSPVVGGTASILQHPCTRAKQP